MSRIVPNSTLRRLVSSPLVAPLLIASALCSNSRAQAHNKDVHAHIVETAVSLIDAVDAQSRMDNKDCPQTFTGSNDFILTPPDDISAADWQLFLQDVMRASCNTGELWANIDAPNDLAMQDCSNHYPDDELIITNQSEEWQTMPLKRMQLPVSTGYYSIDDPAAAANSCQLQKPYTGETNFYVSQLAAAGKPIRYTGSVLGLHTAMIDDHSEDLSTTLIPANSVFGDYVEDILTNTAGGFGAGEQILESSTEDVIECFDSFIDSIFAGNFDEALSECEPSPENIVDYGEDGFEAWKTALKNALNDIGYDTGRAHDLIGVWHHIDINRSGEYDDNPGFLLNKGDLGKMDNFEFALAVLADMGGYSVDKESQGILRYQVTNATDNRPGSVYRQPIEWQYESLAHIEFSPVDNLAHYGYTQFRTPPSGPSNTQSVYLGWPLHAIGDAGVPQHLIGAVGHGHRPYEDAQSNLWNLMTYNQRDIFDPSGTNTKQEQLKQAKRILANTYRWTKWIEAQRSNLDISETPVRDIVLQLGKETYSYVDQHRGIYTTPHGSELNWPFDKDASFEYAVGDSIQDVSNWIKDHGPDALDLSQIVNKNQTMVATQRYMNILTPEGRSSASLHRPLIENTIAATAAFLIATAKNTPTNAACTPPATIAIKNQSGCE